MLKNCMWSPDRDYKSGTEYDPFKFYLDGLANSIEFNLLLGYFSSAAINLLSIGFATFISRGGSIRLVINHLLSEKDKIALQNADVGQTTNKIFDLTDFVSLEKVFNEYDTQFFECLAYLISQKRIKIKIIKPKYGKGIAHYKSGVFHDGENYVGYKASCNFTLFGLSENLEELEAFLSWENGRSNKLIRKELRLIDNYFNEIDHDVDYLSSEKIEVALKDRFDRRTIEELIVQEEYLLKKKIEISNNPIIKNILIEHYTKISLQKRFPHFPFRSTPREYQIEAYTNWVNNNHKGIFAMATGTGKTITALNCVLSEYNNNPDKIYHCLILVPTKTLVEQWLKEAKSFNFNDVYTIYSAINWQHEVTRTIHSSKRIPLSFIIICTYASFIKDKIQNLIKHLPSDTILIADEGHNIASSSVKEKLKDIFIEKRIALSATPKRNYDPEGTAVMEDFFNDREPYTFSFSLEKAISQGFLCEYYYYPHIIKLTASEMSLYSDISRQLAKFYSSNKDNDENKSIIEKLLLKRKRIIHKAHNKLNCAINILKNQYISKGNLKYTFVYVPEGRVIEEKLENEMVTSENIRIIDQFTREIGKIDDKIHVNQFISGVDNRDEILDQFEKGYLDVIASMKCLDEGVDIPRAETAIFCSSTGNPRQFIQRRGRILRKHHNKQNAYIHDLVVVPDYLHQFESGENFDIEKKMIKSELVRVMYFASLSKNKYYTEDLFKNICDYYNINIYQIQNELSL